MSHDDAVAALQAAAQADASAQEEGAEAFIAGNPAGETEPEVQPEEPEVVEPAEKVEPEAPGAPEDTFDGGQFNPDELPEELRPGWRQLNAAYTQKTQQLAEKFKEVEALSSLGIDAETATNAVDLYNRISDSSNWTALYEQLGQAMEQNGIEVPGVTAAPVTAPTAPALDDSQLDALVAADPDLAPLVATLRSQQERLSQVDSFQARLDAMDAERQTEVAEAEEQRVHQQMLAELQQEEQDIRGAFKHYEQEDIDMIYEMSSFHNGDLKAAQARLESYAQARVDRALASKGRPKPASPKPAPKSTKPAELDPEHEPSIRDVEEEAVEHLRALQAAGELDF